MPMWVVQTHENTDDQPFFIWGCEEIERALMEWGDEIVNSWIMWCSLDRSELLEWADANLNMGVE